MLFNSYEFLLLYLPITAIGYFLLAHMRHRAAAAWLALASVFFYGWWNSTYVLLLLGSILFNYLAGLAIIRTEGPVRKQVLSLAVAANLGLLGYYKYANFFVATAAGLFGTNSPALNIVLPLGISFFTFTQIAYLVDVYRGIAKEANFIHYALFVTYFPHLIAGPVLHHKEMMPQFADSATYQARIDNFTVGLTLFFFGLAKKVILADGIAPYAADVFKAAHMGEAPLLFQAWGAALAYTFQLYFDFSGYSDMAIGLSRIFGVKLPLNFDSPYKARNIIDFWRRWHMTLSRFLRDYLYVPLGGNRKGAARRHLNLMTTMLLGGLWHGAGWTFVVWGGLHGIYLVINHAWHWLKAGLGLAGKKETFLARLGGCALTFLAVVVGWVFFRAESLSAALTILAGMAGLNGVSLPAAIVAALPMLEPTLLQAGVQSTLGNGGQFVSTWLWIAALSCIAFLAPNTQQIMRHHEPALEYVTENASRIFWQPSRAWMIGMAVIAVCGVISLNRVSEFLYFQF